MTNYIKRLVLVKSLMKDGYSEFEAMKKLYPPVFFKHKDAFSSALSHNRLSQLKKMLKELVNLELSIKKSSINKTEFIYQALLQMNSFAQDA